jgi:GTP-binding protein EngB required for normal cell division
MVNFIHKEYTPGYFEAHQIKKGYSQQNICPYRDIKVVFVGKSGIGKSSLVNSFMNSVEGKIMDRASTGLGNGNCKTREIDGNHFLARGRLQFIDTPGLNDWDEDAIERVKEYINIKDAFVLMVIVIPKDYTPKADDEIANLRTRMLEISALQVPKVLLLTKNDISVPEEQEKKLLEVLPFGVDDTHRVANLRGVMNERIEERKRHEILTTLIKMLIRAEKEFRNHYKAPFLSQAIQESIQKNAYQSLALSFFLLFFALFLMIVCVILVRLTN